jgi:hypothetical protein
MYEQNPAPKEAQAIILKAKAVQEGMMTPLDGNDVGRNKQTGPDELV